MIRRRVLLDGRILMLELEPEREICRFVVKEEGKPDRSGDASIRAAGDGVYSVLIDDRSFEVRLDSGVAWNRGRVMPLEVQDPRNIPQRSASGARSGPAQITSPMPGKVVRILKSPGDEVEAGEGVLVVEAMKMQNELKAPKAGRIASVSAAEGAAVKTGEILAVIE